MRRRKNPYLDGLQSVERAPCGGDDALSHVDRMHPELTFRDVHEICKASMDGRDWFAERHQKHEMERRRRIADQLSKITS